MIIDGFSVPKAFRHYAGLPIQYIASRSGIPVSRLAVIESGGSATTSEIDSIGKALDLPKGVLGP